VYKCIYVVGDYMCISAYMLLVNFLHAIGDDLMV